MEKIKCARCGKEIEKDKAIPHQIYVRKGVWEWKQKRNGMERKGVHIGLYDINGKEICEGDVVKLEHKTMFSLPSKSTVVIIWDNDNARFWIESDTIDTKYFTMQNLSDFEVVGNIYETPDLLLKHR